MFSSLYIFTIDKFNDNLQKFYKNLFTILEKDYDIWMQNNPYIKILERALNIVQTEVVRISVEHLQLDNLLEERLVNIKLAVDYTSLLALEIEKK